jgi:hypothetical protein
VDELHRILLDRIKRALEYAFPGGEGESSFQQLERLLEADYRAKETVRQVVYALYGREDGTFDLDKEWDSLELLQWIAEIIRENGFNPTEKELRPATALPLLAIESLADEIYVVAGEMIRNRRRGNVIPLPDLRQELRHRNISATDLDVDTALLSLEADFRIDLNAAQSPTTVPDRSQGIERPGRGLLYYLVIRGES